MAEQQQRAIRTRQEILVATANAINELSYEKSTVTDIAKRAGVTTGAFYFHFASKEQAAHTLVELQNELSQRKARATVEAGYPALEAQLRVCADLMDDIVRDPLVRAGIRLTTEIHILDTPPTASWASWIDFNRALILRACEEGDLRKDMDVDGVAEFLTAGVAGVHIFSSLLEDLAGLTRRAHVLWVQFIGAHVLPEKTAYWLGRADSLFRGRAGYPEQWPRLLSHPAEARR